MKKLLFLLSAIVLLTGCSEDKVSNIENEVRQVDAPSIEIGENGNWWINGKDTGVSAKGEPGQPGSGGASTSIEVGTNGNWWINGADTGISARGEPGQPGQPGTSASIEVGTNGNWWINGADTGISARGEPGQPGNDGTSASIEIGTNGNWWINGVDTGVSARGEPGQPGNDGTSTSIEIGTNGNWWINGVDTGVSARGESGQPGQPGQPGQSASEIVSIEWVDGTMTFIFSDGRRLSVQVETPGAGVPGIQVAGSASGFARQWFRLAPQVESSSNVHYRWLLDGVEISTDRELVHVFAEAGDHVLTFTATNVAGASERSISVRIDEPTQAYSPWTNRVYDFVRAPGQYANAYPATPAGSTYESVLASVQSSILSRGLVSLGGYGGYIVMGFDHTVVNGAGNDFIVNGNAFSGWAEPGTIEVSWDANGNGLPDDPWYEIAGSEYDAPTAIHNYVLTYYNPTTDTEREVGATGTRWADNQGQGGYIPTSSWPNWQGDTIVVGGSVYEQSGFSAFAFGYADNWPNSDVRSQIDIDWAVDANGNPANLKGIDFVRVYTGTFNFGAGAFGEISTEVTGAEDLTL